MNALFDFGKRYQNTYSSAPLAFLGQKQNMLKVFFRVLNSHFQISDEMVFLDLFGGSGLLSHNLKCAYANNRVIYNDFDNYASRLMPERMQILSEIQSFANELLKDYSKDRQMNDDEKAKLFAFIDKYPHEKIDFIQLSSWFCFSGRFYTNYEDFKKNAKYNRLSNKKLSAAGYLEGVERVAGDYRAIYQQFKGEKLFLVLDPPYLQTIQNSYQMHFGLGEFLDLMDILREAEIWILFSSERSI